MIVSDIAAGIPRNDFPQSQTCAPTFQPGVGEGAWQTTLSNLKVLLMKIYTGGYYDNQYDYLSIVGGYRWQLHFHWFSTEADNPRRATSK